MKKIWLILSMILIYNTDGFSQAVTTEEKKILFSGIIRDATTLEPLPNSQIKINRASASVSDEDGTFTIRVHRKDTVIFSLLGYRTSYFYVSDTLTGNEFMAGVYMKTDTLSIGEVIIMPRIQSLKYDIFKPPATSPEMENAKYNMAVSAYQGRIAMTQLGDPASNYSVVQQKRLRDASEKGTIPSDRMVGMSPFMLVGVAYLLINGLPEKPAPMKSNLTRQELDQINKKYLERITKK
jgi:CarboxypepD_reg-like domain